MNGFCYSLAEHAKKFFALPDPILEMGSLLVNEKVESAFNLRTLFPGSPYIGCDQKEGPGVDRIENVEKMTFEDGEVGTVLAFNLYEHVWNIFDAFSEMYRVLVPDGVAVVCVPFYLHLHGYPNDFWRMTPDTIGRLMGRFSSILIGTRGHRTKPSAVFAIGFKGRGEDKVKPKLGEFLSDLYEKGSDTRGAWESTRLHLGRIFMKKKYLQEQLDFNLLDARVYANGGRVNWVTDVIHAAKQ